MAATAPKTWQDVAATAQKLRDESIAEVEPAIPEIAGSEKLPLNVTSLPAEYLSADEIHMTEEMGAEELVRAMAGGELKCVDVTNAFLRRAGLAQKLTNCITELLPSAAKSRAKYLDDYLAAHSAPIGPLHGLPISVKEHVGMKGLGANAGFVAWWDHVASEDAHILKLLWQAGAVFYARTTEPQTLMHLETSNNLYGETVNPFNRNLTAGGSSGGEGALLGLRGSCLGVGTDIGGSIRSPAANNGVYGLRPTSYRLPFRGIASTMIGQEHIVPVIGPLSTSLQGCKMFMKAIIDQGPWLTEPSLVPVPWRMIEGTNRFDQMVNKKTNILKVAVMWDDRVVKPHPPITRALTEVAEKLKRCPQIQVVDWKPYKHDLAWKIIASLYLADGANDEKTALEANGEPWRPLSEFIISENPYCKELTIAELWDLTRQRDEYREAYAAVWNKTAAAVDDDENDPDTSAVDVILCPVGPGAAPPLNHARYWPYTSQWNLLDYPALVFPVTKSTRRKTWSRLDSPERYIDAPVSLQLVGRRFDDEKIIEALEFMKATAGI